MIGVGVNSILPFHYTIQFNLQQQAQFVIPVPQSFEAFKSYDIRIIFEAFELLFYLNYIY